MNFNEIQERIDALVPIMASKGMRQSSATMHIKSHAEISVGGSWKDEGRAYGEAFHYVRADNPEAAIAAFEDWLAAQPDAEQRKLNDFMAALGKVIDMGRETGIEVDFINPLTETMKRLSENALTYQPQAAE